MNNTKFWKFFIVFSAILVVILLSFLIPLMTFNIFNQEADAESLDIYEDGRRNVLILGTDESGLRADVLLIASFSDKGGPVNLTSIPRDTRMQTSGGGNKINSSLAIGGEDYTIKKVKEVTGIPIHDFVKVNFKAVEEIVDALGGIKFDVPEDMNYEDPYQDLYIDLEKGMQKLDGEQALHLLRYRQYAMADIRRTEVQRDFLKAAFDQKAKLRYIFKIPAIMNSISDNMTTSISSTEALSYVMRVKDRSDEGFNTIELPYTLSSSYVMISPSSIKNIVEENFK